MEGPCVSPWALGVSGRSAEYHAQTRVRICFIVSPDLVTIERFRDLPEALLAKGKLESAGIRCFLADSELVRTDWL